jgi:hypothetical protein
MSARHKRKPDQRIPVQTESETRKMVSQHGRNEQIGAYTQAYLKGYEEGYAKGRNQEARIQERNFRLWPSDIEAINRFATSIGYISPVDHEEFRDLLKRMDEHVQSLQED